MSLELLNTIGTLVTVIIVATAAIAALVQLRHLRASNQINAQLAVGAAFDDQRFRDSMDLVRRSLALSMETPTFRELITLRGAPVPDTKNDETALRNAAILCGNKFEELGILVKHRMIDEMMCLDRFSRNIERAWNVLCPFVAFVRKFTGDAAIYENFEYLAVRAEDFHRAHPTSYPAGARRMNVESSWPIPPTSPVQGA
jgi:hypothetical protein